MEIKYHLQLRRFICMLFCIVLASISSIKAQEFPKVIFPGDYPDPSILRDGEDFYMTHSSFSYSPGFLIWHSRDLVNWEPVCRVKGAGMAPDLVKYGDTYYLYFPWGPTNYVTWHNFCSCINKIESTIRNRNLGFLTVDSIIYKLR